MKKNLFLIAFCFAGAITGAINGCKKDAVSIYNNGPIAKSFTEEFADVVGLTTKGWIFKDNSFADSVTNYDTGPGWSQGPAGTDKAGNPYGFPAYSYKSSPDEYAYSATAQLDTNYSTSSWLITPVLSVKNGDKISFYTMANDDINRMQVLMNKSASSDVGSTFSSTGDFNTILLDINSSQSSGGYPGSWTKYEYTFSGISGKIDTRIAFRHYLNNPHIFFSGGVGIDQFKFQVN